MTKRICPFCREAIHPEAMVCAHCQRDQPASTPSRRCATGWLAGLALATVMAAGTAILVRGFLEERRHWLE